MGGPDGPPAAADRFSGGTEGSAEGTGTAAAAHRRAGAHTGGTGTGTEPEAHGGTEDRPEWDWGRKWKGRSQAGRFDQTAPPNGTPKGLKGRPEGTGAAATAAASPADPRRDMESKTHGPS